MIKLTVTAGGVKHVGGKENARNFDNVVGGAANTCGERAETNGRGFTNDDPRSRSGTKGEENGHNQTKGSLSEVGGGRNAEGGSDTKSDEEDGVDSRTPQIDGASTVVGRQNPGLHDEDHLEGGGDEAKSESQILADVSLLEELDGLVGNQVTSSILSGVDTANNKSTTEIGALGESDVARLLGRLFHLNNTTHHCNLIGRVEWSLASYDRYISSLHYRIGYSIAILAGGMVSLCAILTGSSRHKRNQKNQGFLNSIREPNSELEMTFTVANHQGRWNSLSLDTISMCQTSRKSGA